MRWGERIAAANRAAVAKILEVRPVWTDVAEAKFVIADMGEHDLHHAGPPIDWERMADAERRAVVDAILFEGWADTPDRAASLAERRGVRLLPNLDRGGAAVAPGILSPSMPVFVVEDMRHGGRAYGVRMEPLIVEPGDEAARELRVMWRAVLAPTLARAVQAVGGIDLTALLVEALARGDDLHLRTSAATSMIALDVMGALLKAAVPRSDMEAVIAHLRSRDRFFLPLAMASAKLMADAASDIDDATLVTALCANGGEVGIRVAGLGDRWFSAPAPSVPAGDDALLEAMGFGSAVLGGAPALYERVGATGAEVLQRVRSLREIAGGVHPEHRVAGLGEAAAPLGVDIRRVVETGIVPFVDGVQRAPIECFVQAVEAFAEARGLQ